MTPPMPTLKLHTEPLQTEWLDAYGHLNEAYYLVPFSNANWKLQDHFGIGVEYFDRTGGALYTVETHLRYVREVRAPANLEVETYVLGADEKRIWHAHRLIVDGIPRATGEFMSLHYDSKLKRVAPLPETVRRALTDAIIQPHPDWVGGKIALTR